MGKASRSKQDRRNSPAGEFKPNTGDRTWTIVIGALAIVGVVLIAVVAMNKKTAVRAAPLVNDHWHAAVGVNICGTWDGNLPTYESDVGVHSHGDGLIHMHPYKTDGEGKNASVGNFYGQSGYDYKFSETSIETPSGKYENGDKCEALDNKPGEVRWFVDGKEKSGNPWKYAPFDGEVVTIAFVPKDYAVGEPPSVTALANPSDVPSTGVTGPTQTIVVPGETTASSTDVATQTTTVSASSTQTTKQETDSAATTTTP